MLFEFGEIGDVADVVALASLFDVTPVQFLPGELLAAIDGFHHRYAVFAPTAHVVNLARPRIGGELLDGANHVVTMDVVANLFALVPKNGIFRAADRAFHQIRKKSVQFDSRVRRPGQTASAKNAYIHLEVATVFLRDKVRRRFRSSKKRVQCAVNAAIFANAAEILRARVVPPRGKFLQRNFVGSVAVNLVSAHEKENRFGAVLTRGFEKIERSEGVNFEIEDGNVPRLVVRRLRGAVNDQIETLRLEKFVERGAI